MKKESNKLEGRADFQKKEGYRTDVANYPDDRMQSSKQVLTSTELGVTPTAVGTSIAPTEVGTTNAASAVQKVKANVSIKPNANVEELEGKQVGGVPLGAGMLVRSAAGSRTYSPASDISRNPHTDGGYRPSTRYGKKVSEQNFEINNSISEQTIPVFDESKDLREAPDSKQGYNGRKQFNQSRGKRNAGSNPKGLLFDRSADLITCNEEVYTSGQILDNIPTEAGYPTKTYIGIGADGADDRGYADMPLTMAKSNYTLDGFNFRMVDGHIQDVSFTESRFAPHVTSKEQDVSNMNWQVDLNNITQAMVNMQTKLGRETTDKWSPLAYVVRQPYQYNMLYHDMENVTGSLCALAYRSSVCSMETFLNLIAKDGAQPTDPGFGNFLQGIGTVAGNATFKDQPFASLFSDCLSQNGSVAAIIKMFDSITKYSTKADLYTMQRGIKLMLSQADNNLNPLHMKKKTMKAIDCAHKYSTVDGKYNPYLPIYQTGTIRAVNSMSLNFFLEGWRNPHTDPSTSNDNLTGTATKMQYAYNDIRNNTYVMPVKHPLVEGLLKWLLQHEADLVKAFGRTGYVTMPATFNMSYPSLFQFMLCAASQDIAFMRNTYFRDILFAGEQETYVWDDLTSLKDLNPLYSSQLRIGSYDEALGLGKLTAASKIRTLWPEHFMVHGEQTGEGADYVLPWYFNEMQFNAEPDASGSWLSDDHASCMTMPSIRSGVRHDYVDVLYSMDERDIRLCLDRMTTIPSENVTEVLYPGAGAQTAGVYIPVGSYFHNDFDTSRTTHLSAIRYDENSDGRVMVTYDGNLSYASLMLVPRELGFLCPDAACGEAFINRVVTTYDDHRYSTTLTFNPLFAHPVNHVWTVPYMQLFVGEYPMRLTSYAALGCGCSVTANSIDITSAIQQDFVRFFANRYLAAVNADFVARRNFAPCFSALFAAGSLNTLNVDYANILGVYGLKSNNASETAGSTMMVTLTTALWGILNRIFFPTNPFENCLTPSTATDASAGVYVDPMEGAYLFNVAGSLASDYNQDTLERLDEYDQLNMNYLEDAYIRDSLIFRE